MTMKCVGTDKQAEQPTFRQEELERGWRIDNDNFVIRSGYCRFT